MYAFIKSILIYTYCIITYSNYCDGYIFYNSLKEKVLKLTIVIINKS